MTDGYPDKEDIEWLKEELNTTDFVKGGLALCELLTHTRYARCLWLGKVSDRIGLEVATGGWSGCEEIIEATYGTLWRMRYWESTHRGGLERFTIQ